MKAKCSKHRRASNNEITQNCFFFQQKSANCEEKRLVNYENVKMLCRENAEIFSVRVGKFLLCLCMWAAKKRKGNLRERNHMLCHWGGECYYLYNFRRLLVLRSVSEGWNRCKRRHSILFEFRNYHVNRNLS